MKKILTTLAVAAAATMAAPAMAADNCATVVESNDVMQFNVKNIDVPKSCKTFQIELKHVGKLPKTAMGHNIVIAATSDVTAVAGDGIKAGPANDYIKPDDARILAHSKLIGGGESTTLDVDVSKFKADGAYTFFCSFPAHSSIMRGTITLK